MRRSTRFHHCARSTVQDLLRLGCCWLALVMGLQGLAMAHGLGLGPLHRHHASEPALPAAGGLARHDRLPLVRPGADAGQHDPGHPHADQHAEAPLHQHADAQRHHHADALASASALPVADAGAEAAVQAQALAAAWAQALGRLADLSAPLPNATADALPVAQPPAWRNHLSAPPLRPPRRA